MCAVSAPAKGSTDPDSDELMAPTVSNTASITLPAPSAPQTFRLLVQHDPPRAPTPGIRIALPPAAEAHFPVPPFVSNGVRRSASPVSETNELVESPDLPVPWAPRLRHTQMDVCVELTNENKLRDQLAQSRARHIHPPLRHKDLSTLNVFSAVDMARFGTSVRFR